MAEATLQVQAICLKSNKINFIWATFVQSSLFVCICILSLIVIWKIKTSKEECPKEIKDFKRDESEFENFS